MLTKEIWFFKIQTTDMLKQFEKKVIKTNLKSNFKFLKIFLNVIKKYICIYKNILFEKKKIIIIIISCLLIISKNQNYSNKVRVYGNVLVNFKNDLKFKSLCRQTDLYGNIQNYGSSFKYNSQAVMHV